MTNPYRIGTRKSALALKQTDIVLKALQKAHPDNIRIQNAEIIGITTTGDQIQNKSLSKIGGKALFVKEIEQALSDNQIDFGIHSLKDVEANLHPNFKLACVLEREIMNDVLITRDGQITGILDLKPQAVLGTCSPRRAAQLLEICPDLQIVPLRGNILTRLSKFDEKEMDATVLAYAGLKRLDLVDDEGNLKGYPGLKACVLTLDEMIPAVGQGVLTVETLKTNQEVINLLSVINHQETEMCIRAERAFLRELAGNCKTPIAAFCVLTPHQTLLLKAFYAPLSGMNSIRYEAVGTFNDPEELGIRVGKEIKRQTDDL